MDRSAVTAELLDELASHQPAKFMRYIREGARGRRSASSTSRSSFTLDAEGPLPMARLAEAMDVSQASATGIVDRMEQRGLVERQRDDADRRVVRVALDRGRPPDARRHRRRAPRAPGPDPRPS